MIKMKPIPQNLHTQSEINVTEDEKVMHSDSRLIMMRFEEPFMKAGAKTVAEKGGDVLNVGFGLGMIDTEIQKYSPKSHHIIEIHPSIHKKIISDDWDIKPNVNLYFGDWRDFVDELPKMDGIYFDTLEDQEFYDFIALAWKLLKPGGVFSFFNNPDPFAKDDSQFYNRRYHDIIHQFYNVEFETILVSQTDIELQRQYSSYGGYWNEKRKKYFNIILKPKKEYQNE